MRWAYSTILLSSNGANTKTALFTGTSSLMHTRNWETMLQTNYLERWKNPKDERSYAALNFLGLAPVALRKTVTAYSFILTDVMYEAASKAETKSTLHNGLWETFNWQVQRKNGFRPHQLQPVTVKVKSSQVWRMWQTHKRTIKYNTRCNIMSKI